MAVPEFQLTNLTSRQECSAVERSAVFLLGFYPDTKLQNNEFFAIPSAHTFVLTMDRRDEKFVAR
jgi:hypothetical protein